MLEFRVSWQERSILQEVCMCPEGNTAVCKPRTRTDGRSCVRSWEGWRHAFGVVKIEIPVTEISAFSSKLGQVSFLLLLLLIIRVQVAQPGLLHFRLSLGLCRSVLPVMAASWVSKSRYDRNDQNLQVVCIFRLSLPKSGQGKHEHTEVVRSRGLKPAELLVFVWMILWLSRYFSVYACVDFVGESWTDEAVPKTYIF
jgi:hypothetical protein